MAANNTINKDEYGEPILIDMSEDISSNTNQIIIKNPEGTLFTKTATAGATTKTTSIGQVVSGEYVEYVIEQGLLDMVGRWFVRGASTGGGKYRKTNWLPMVVKP